MKLAYQMCQKELQLRRANQDNLVIIRYIYPEVKFQPEIYPSYPAIISVILTQRKQVHEAKKKLHLRTKIKTEVQAGKDNRIQYLKKVMLQKCYQSWYESNQHHKSIRKDLKEIGLTLHNSNQCFKSHLRRRYMTQGEG